jgi:hypothetical protein
MVTQSTTPCRACASPLQGDAWAAWNASYHEPNADAYRALARALYRQDVQERIMAQFARLDEQNARLDALLSSAIPASRLTVGGRADRIS